MIDSIPFWTNNATPFKPEEVDTHPDRDRLWATLEKVRNEAEEDAESVREELSEEITDIANEREAETDKLSDAFACLQNAELKLCHDDAGMPFRIAHNLVPTSDTDQEIIELMEERLDELLENFLDEHFREVDDAA